MSPSEFPAAASHLCSRVTFLYFVFLYIKQNEKQSIESYIWVSSVPTQASTPLFFFYFFSPQTTWIDLCHSACRGLRACRHGTDRWYSPIIVSSLADGWWASVSWHSSMSCSQMLPQRCSDLETGPADESPAAAPRTRSNDATKWSAIFLGAFLKYLGAAFCRCGAVLSSRRCSGEMHFERRK